MTEYQNIQLLLNKVFKERRIDFTHYREKLIHRRINTRLRATHCSSYEEYFHLLNGNREEMDTLLKALTINVTQFFRDPKVFKTVKTEVFPEIIKHKERTGQNTFRIWSCACSGGQEATSLLIMLLEYLEKEGKDFNIHIYGTDIDEFSVEKAKDGVYENYEVAPIRNLERYFINAGNDRFWRKKELNKYLFFKEHDVTRDKPLTNMDLIFCRNLFIYFKPSLQNICIEKFYSSLKDGGFFVLGITEILRAETGKFFEFDRSKRIYQKKQDYKSE